MFKRFQFQKIHFICRIKNACNFLQFGYFFKATINFIPFHLGSTLTTDVSHIWNFYAGKKIMESRIKKKNLHGLLMKYSLNRIYEFQMNHFCLSLTLQNERNLVEHIIINSNSTNFEHLQLDMQYAYLSTLTG